MPAHQPTQLHALFAQAFNRGELDELLALYEPNATVVVGGEPVAGHHSVRTALERWLAAGGQMVLDTRAVIEGPDGLVVLHGAWAIASPEAPPSATVRRGLSTEVARRQSDGTWRFVIDNPDTPI
jgi:ketosteroid isomerase-like protein